MVTNYEGEPICRCVDSDSGPVGFHNTQGLRCYFSINFFIKILYKLLSVNQVYTASHYKTTTSRANFHIELPIYMHNYVYYLKYTTFTKPFAYWGQLKTVKFIFIKDPKNGVWNQPGIPRKGPACPGELMQKRSLRQACIEYRPIYFHTLLA